MTLPTFIVVFICYTSSYNMKGIIWKQLLIVNWPLLELSNSGVPQSEAFQWMSLAEVKTAGRGAGQMRGLRIAVRCLVVR
ncbi:hypothetical protein DZG01_07520 [Pseudomonas fluorescens]|nr:hypothetical protein DZG01_07520 [Pseudomonas fluorescens]